ncbi:MAG TPA: branched-chain amino acid ABC transporter permease [Gaiellaceae bacterium]|nr:branched-chain amino acid ABC transporter permease [Gaiellaceae bacterium]
MSEDAPTPGEESGSTSPQIGIDEWVKRSGERIAGPGGVFGGAVRVAGRTPRILLLAVFIGFACVLPLLTSNGYVIGVDADTLLYVLLAIGLNVAVGWAGLLDLGYIVYYGFGAYLYAELSSAHYNLHWPTWQSVPVVVAFTVLLGFVLALPSRRLRGDYLAIVTLFFLQMFNNFTTNGYTLDWFGAPTESGLTGGPTGINNVDPFRVFGHALTNSPTDYVWAAAAGITVVAILFTFVNRSRTGRAWRALREDPLAAEAMGIPVKWLMLLAVAVGAGVAGYAGAVNGAYYQGVFPDTFMFPLLITIYAMVILGGAGSLGGVIFGAVTVNVLLEVLRTPAHARWIFYAALLIGLLAKLRPWRVLAAVLGGLVAFGVAANQIAGAISAKAVAGPIAVGPTAYTKHGFFATLVRHWMILPGGTYTNADYKPGNYAFVATIALVLALTLVKGWKRWALLVPTLWLAAFAWETDLVNQAPTVRPLFLGVILIVLMVMRPAGLFGQSRVEVV